jgi:hypothetical protein
VIRVVATLLPFGKLEGSRVLYTFDIANDGTGDNRRGNYKARYGKAEEWVEKVVENYPRLSYPVGRLLYLALKAKFG